jgi:DNA-binding MarR family transcriptional regulator
LPLIRALVHALAQSARTVERRTGITNAQLFIVHQLADDGELTINELAARVLTQQSTVSLLVARLSAAGLVKRARSPVDRRRICVSLTAKGRRLAQRAPAPPMARLLHALNELSPADRRHLSRGLTVLLARMHVNVPATAPLFEPR